MCVEHRDALDGAALGMLELEGIRDAELARKALKSKKKRRKGPSPVWDMRNAAAATTTPERLEPDPARACPAPTLKDESILENSPGDL
jgi:hypothetical protein